MKQKQFELVHTKLWEEIAAILKGVSLNNELLPSHYRRLCQCLALSSQRGYSPTLTDYLQKMVSDCHKRLYGSAVERPILLRAWLLHDLPCRVRQEWRLLLVALLAFWGVALTLGMLVWLKPYWAFSFLSPQELSQYQHMYQPGQLSIGRDGSQGDVYMFGFYIWHNVSICFRTFAGGIFGGAPAILSLLRNGMNLGVIASWLSQDAAASGTFWPFVVTHSSFEITGLLLSGVAGMRLGLSLISPGRLSRRHALLVASRRMFPVIVGAALLTMLAAFFEAFWSASDDIPDIAKFIVGGICWLSVLAFFSLAGRSRR